MATQRTDANASATTTMMAAEERAMPRGRRGIIAGAAALVMGALTSGPAKPVRANDGNSLTLGVNFLNTSSTETELIMTTATDVNAAFSVHVQGGGTSPAMIALGGGAGQGIKAFGGPNGGAGVVGAGGGGNADGVQGTGRGTFTGVVGFGGEKGGSGVLGVAGGGGGTKVGAGVIGITPGFNLNAFGLFAGVNGGSNIEGVPGVYGQGTLGNTPGVLGSGSNASAGVFGINSNAAGIGVGGFNEFGPAVEGGTGTGYGVFGHASNNGIGVYGTSTTGFGVVGTTSAASFGVYGVTNADGAAAFAGGTTNASAYAAIFTGTTVVNGQFVVNGGAKNAAVKHPDGTHRLLYCMESPESWFEDFGEGTIAAGKAEVKLDPDFAAVADTTKLHVFTEAHDAHHALHIAGKSATGFTVEVNPSAVGVAAGKKASDLSGTFTYRVVAKRKDIAAPRLARFTVPQPKVEVPKPPVAQKPPVLPEKP